MILDRIAIFIEPQGSLRDALVERKSRLESEMPGQTYTTHPPHCTLIVGDYGEPEAWLDKLRNCVAKASSFEVATDGWQQFANDPLTHGGQTVAYRVRPIPAIFALQVTVATVLAPFHRASPESHPLAGSEPFATSIKRYGSPFVGKHWIPHFTIGSPRVPADRLPPFLVAGSPYHAFQVETISVWRVRGDDHAKLYELVLRKQSNQK